MARGRPLKSKIRQNIIEILYFLGEGYGYEVAKIYNEVFAPVTQRSIYYHLRKGVQSEELMLYKIQEEKGEFSWGNSVEKIYYALGANARPVGMKRVKQYLKRIKR